MLKRILINILLIAVFFSVIEAYCFYKTKAENETFKLKADKLASNNTRQYKLKYKILEPYNTEIDRNSFIKENTNYKPIIWFGCSFAVGAGLEDNQTPCFKISNLTQRSCINKAKGATGTQFMYYQLKNDEEMSNAADAEYIIYTFIWNHIQRLYNYQINPLIDMFNLRYKVVNGNLEEIKPVFKPLYSSFFIKRILNRKVNTAAKKESVNFDLFNKIIEESVKLSKKRYPNSKFILLEFPDLSRNELPEYEIKKLEEMGITVIRVENLIDKEINIYDEKYWLPDNIHPASEAWDIILPELVKKYIKE